MAYLDRADHRRTADGYPGLILAPIVLNYLRVEMLTVEVRPVQEKIELLDHLLANAFEVKSDENFPVVSVLLF